MFLRIVVQRLKMLRKLPARSVLQNYLFYNKMLYSAIVPAKEFIVDKTIFFKKIQLNLKSISVTLAASAEKLL